MNQAGRILHFFLGTELGLDSGSMGALWNLDLDAEVGSEPEILRVSNPRSSCEFHLVYDPVFCKVYEKPDLRCTIWPVYFGVKENQGLFWRPEKKMLMTTEMPGPVELYSNIRMSSSSNKGCSSKKQE